MFIKAFDKDLRGCERFQFEVGVTYTTEDDNPAVWFHYAGRASAALCFYRQVDTRFCIVEPLGRIHKRPHHMFIPLTIHATDSIRIVAELSRDEVYRMLLEENCPFWLTNILRPPFEVMARYGKRIRGRYVIREIIKNRDDFTLEQKFALLPKKYHKNAQYHDMTMAVIMQRQKRAEELTRLAACGGGQAP